MSAAHWTVVGLLAVAAFTIRVAGLIAGEQIRTSQQGWILAELPGLIVVSLVASSLGGEPLPTWIAAGAALGVAIVTNHVIATMVAGMLIYACLAWLGA
ncbi:AzlD domain-containing protein [Rhizobium pusense]|uniref:AzlD domain-containing protein n=1 Tax=Agrobacterium pusense TaxID=648995 RepID=UPI000D1A8767|nr:AzlD domain-containing protein [Agrobacterium pusense]MDH0908520.1 AzlD domain-containing protein [Agrobacterium pusense]MDH1094352.1 AzlD domain-containing protein [Agrobacterium pusense]MDH1110934.1 AzlD domain-containing protein [Agrobacterium pusense]MDH2192062.1 AzlD domain-containing protein [Agrobacterium pusense]